MVRGQRAAELVNVNSAHMKPVRNTADSRGQVVEEDDVDLPDS